MIPLEAISAGFALAGLEAPVIANVVSVGHVADGAVKERLLNRANEPNIRLATAERHWSFDGDGETFKLTVEARRIDRAFLTDPLMAVHTSNVEPLPHQITAVDESVPHFVSNPFDAERGWGVSFTNFDLKALLELSARS